MGLLIGAAKILGVLTLLVLGIVAYAAGLRSGYLLDPVPTGSRIARDLRGTLLPAPDPRLQGATLRVAVLGTSLTARYAWPEEMRAGLAACLGRAVTLTKTAKAGAGSDWGATAVSEIAAGRPDLTLIEFSINDADLTDGIWLNVARRRHQAMIDALRAANPDMRIALVTMSPAHGPRGWVRPFLGAHEDMYRRLAEEMDLDLIDLAPLWAAALEEGGSGLLPDGLHPTEAAVAKVALPTIAAQAGKILGARC